MTFRQIITRITVIIVFIISALAIVLPLVPASVSASEIIDSGKCGKNVTWTFDSDGVLTISGSGDMDNFDHWNHYWCNNVMSVNKVVITDGVTSIGDYAFADWDLLKSITIPNSVTSIGSSAFLGCNMIADVSIPNSVTYIGNQAFYGCDSLEKINIPDSVIQLNGSTFSHCKSLKEIKLSKDLTIIGSSEFSNCSSIQSIDIPSGVTSIGSSAFHSCYSLSEINIPNGITIIEDCTFLECTSLVDIVIPNGVISIGDSTFSGCTSLFHVEIPDSVVSIGAYAFYECKSLNNIVLPCDINKIEQGLFKSCDSLENVVVQNRVTTIDIYAFSGCTKLKNVTIPENVQLIGMGAFSNCKTLTSITIPVSVSSIGHQAFAGCTNLKCITFPHRRFDTVLSFGESAFGDCSQLTSVIIPNGVTHISEGLFTRCSNLSSIVIPKDIISIGYAAFFDCKSLTNVHYSESEEQWNRINIGSYNEYLTKATIHFNSIVLNDSSNSVYVRLFTSWDAQNKVAYFGDFDFLGCRVTEKTDTSFLANIDNLIGKYVWVESEPIGNGIVDSDILICIKEIETRVGTVSSADLTNIAIDGITYSTPSSLTLPGLYEGELVRYYLSNGTLLGLDFADDSDIPTDDTQGGSGDIIGDDSNDSEREIIVYALDTSLTFRIGKQFSLLCVLKENGQETTDWSQPAVTIGNENILSLAKCEKSNLGYMLTFNGKSIGTTTVSITDSSDGTFASVSLTVMGSCAEPVVYTIDSVPSFYPDVFGDRKNLTNFYDINGIYVKNFPENPKSINGEYYLSFDVYNTSYMHGSVDVYNAKGEWIRSQCIDKYSDISSITDSVVTAWSMAKDVVNLRTFSYMSTSYSQHTHIDIYVPEGGYIVISNNMAKSPGAYLYNAVDLMIMWAELTMDIAVDSASLQNIKDMTLKEVLKSQAFFDAHMKQFNSFAVKVVGEAVELSIADSMDVITTQTLEIFEDLGIDFWSIVSFAAGVSESVFVSALPPIAKLPLEILSAMTKYFNAASQTLDISYSCDKEYVVLYTPLGGHHMIVEGVSVSPETDALPDNAVMKVFRVSNDEAPLIIGTESVIEAYEVYNISFVVNNNEIQPNGYVTIRIPLPDGYSAKATTVLHEVSDGVWETVDSRVENGLIVFEVNHFSNFAVAHIESDTSITVLAGDVNGDGKISVLDSITLMLYLAGKPAEIVNDAADSNGDGIINKKDCQNIISLAVNGIKESAQTDKCEHVLVKAIDFVPATCTSNGTAEGWQCTKCNKLFKDQTTKIAVTAAKLTIPAGHTEGEWIIDKEATKTEDGSKHQICSKCGETLKSAAILATGSSTASIGLAYEVNADGVTCWITGIGTCADTDVVIPSVVDGYIVKGVYGFSYNESLTSVTILDGPTIIGDEAFRDCTNIESIVIPDSVTSIGAAVFTCCSSLKTISLPKKVESWGYFTDFEGCYELTSVALPEGITTLRSEFFSYCRNLVSVTIPKTVTAIQAYAFDPYGILTDVYYSGTEADWEEIVIADENACLRNATIHCNN